MLRLWREQHCRFGQKRTLRFTSDQPYLLILSKRLVLREVPYKGRHHA
jgi:hypothetical protein